MNSQVWNASFRWGDETAITIVEFMSAADRRKNTNTYLLTARPLPQHQSYAEQLLEILRSGFGLQL